MCSSRSKPCYELVFHQSMCKFISTIYMEVHKHILASVLRQSTNKDQRCIWGFHIYVEFKGDTAAASGTASKWRQDTFPNTHCIFMLVAFFSFRISISQHWAGSCSTSPQSHLQITPNSKQVHFTTWHHVYELRAPPIVLLFLPMELQSLQMGNIAVKGALRHDSGVEGERAGLCRPYNKEESHPRQKQ